MTTAQEFADAAVAFRGARFQHRGRSPVGCDCAGIVLGPAWQIGIGVDDFTDYERTPMGAVVLAATEARCTPRDWHEFRLPGRVLLLRHRDDGEPRHFAVSLGGGFAIHQESRARVFDLREKLETLHSTWILNGVEA